MDSVAALGVVIKSKKAEEMALWARTVVTT